MSRPRKVTTQTKRGPYKKKWSSEDHKHAIENIEFLEPPNEIHVKQENRYADLDCLAVFCDSFDKFDDDTKHRVIGFLFSRYKQYVYFNGTT